MVPPWLPQNIQKRVFRYILSRLPVFSNLDLNNIDVSIGTTQTQLCLNNVELDTEKLSSLPGVFVRHGSINCLDIKFAVLGSVKIEGTGISLTVSLTHKILDDKDEIASILARTTVDFANSILISDDSLENSSLISKNELVESITSSSSGNSGAFFSESLESSEGGDNVGYGLGDFSGVLRRVADAAISQLNVVLRDITIRLVMEDVTVDVVINSFKLSTNESGLRQISVTDFEWILISTERNETVKPSHETGPNKSSLSNTARINKTNSTTFNDNSTNSSHSHLAESMFFSHADANSLYMSAVSMLPESEPSKPEKPKPRLLWCESLFISFPGLDFSLLEISTGQINISLKHFPSVILPLINFIKTHKSYSESNSSKKEKSTKSIFMKNSNNLEDFPKKIEKNTESLNQPEINISKISIKKIEVNLTSLMLPHGLFENDDSIRIIVENVDFQKNKNSEIFFDIGVLSILDSENSILKFSHSQRENSSTIRSVNELTGHIGVNTITGAKTVKFTLPFRGSVSLSLENIFSIRNTISSFGHVFDALSTLSQHQNKETNIPLSVIGQTNSFDIKLTVADSIITAFMFPISFDKNSFISISKIALKIDTENSVDLDQIKIFYLNSVTKSITIDSINSNICIEKLQAFHKECDTKWRKLLSSTRLEAPFLHQKPDIPSKYTVDHTEKSNLEKNNLWTISIKYIGLQVTLPSKINTVVMDFGNANFQATISGDYIVSLLSLHVSRDMSDIDESLGYLTIIHSSQEKLQV